MGSIVIQLYAGECTPSLDRAWIRFRSNVHSGKC